MYSFVKQQEHLVYYNTLRTFNFFKLDYEINYYFHKVDVFSNYNHYNQYEYRYQSWCVFV